MIITGIFVNGPYAMITTAVSADLVSTYVCIHCKVLHDDDDDDDTHV